MNYGYATLPGEDGRTVVDPRSPSACLCSLHAHCDRRRAGRRLGRLDVLEVAVAAVAGAAYLAHRLAPSGWSASSVSAAATALRSTASWFGASS